MSRRKNRGGGFKSEIQYNKQQEVNKEELTIQAFAGIELLDHQSDKWQSGQRMYCYGIPWQWYYDWQEYVGLDDIKQGQEPQGKNYAKKSPGKINQKSIEAKKDNWLYWPEEMQESLYLNIYLNSEVDTDEIQFVDKQVWQFFRQVYSGDPIIRPCLYRRQKMIIDRELSDPYIVFLTPQLIEEISNAAQAQQAVTYMVPGRQGRAPKPETRYEPLFQINVIQVSRYWTFKELYEKFRQYIESVHKLYDQKIRIWMIQHYLRREDVVDSLIEKIRASDFKINGQILDENLEETIQFSDISQKFRSQTLSSLTKSSHNFSSVVRVNAPNALNTSHFNSPVYARNEEDQYKNQKFHSTTCDIAYDSESDDEFEQIEEIKEQKYNGLNNIGNTCYMNAALQCLFRTQQFSEFFLKNQYLKYLKNADDKKKYKLNRKFGKLIKQMTIGNREDLAPWAVQVLLSEVHGQFSGQNQQDSMDLICSLFDALNENMVPTEMFADGSQKEPIVQLSETLREIYEKIVKQNLEKENQKEFILKSSNCEQVEKEESKNIKEEAQQAEIQNNNQQFQKEEKSPEDIFKDKCLVEQKALEFWNSNLSNGVSEMLSSTFFGLFNSTIICPDCNQTSSNFQSFNVVPLSIQFQPTMKGFPVHLVRYDISLPIETFPIIFVSGETDIQQIQQKLAKNYNVNPRKLIPAICSAETVSEVINDPYKKKADEIDREIRNKNKKLVFYEMNIEVLNEVGKLRPGIALVNLIFRANIQIVGILNGIQQVSPISIPRIIAIEPTITSMASVYSEIAQILKCQYDFLELVIQNFIEIRNQINQKQNEIQEKDQKIKNEEIKKDEQLSEAEFLQSLPFQIKLSPQTIKKAGQQGGSFCKLCDKQSCRGCEMPFQLNTSVSDFMEVQKVDYIELILDWDDQGPKTLTQHSFSSGKAGSDEIQKSNTPSLRQCIDLFSKEQELSEGNQWFCEACNDLKQAYKKMLIHYSPKNIIFQLQRFRVNEKGDQEKNHQQVLFQENMDLTGLIHCVAPHLLEEVENQVRYRLYGLVVHEGNLNSGHYWAYAKHGQEWLQFDDSKVSVVTSDEVIDHKNAYLLFYQLIGKSTVVEKMESVEIKEENEVIINGE